MGFIRSIALVTVTFFVISGCATSRRIDITGIPNFYLNPPSADDAMYGVGDARMSSLSTSRTIALSRARDDIARQVEVLVKSVITDYAQEAGAGNNRQAIEFTETVSRQLVEVTLCGLKTKEVAVGKTGSVYAMVEYPINSLILAANETFIRNQAAAFAEFNADEALEMLDLELDNNPPRAGGGQ